MSTVSQIPGGSIPVISPEGQPGFLPLEHLHDALGRGFKQAVVMTSPEGQEGLIPIESAKAALAKGFKVGQAAVDQQSQLQHTSLMDTAKGMAGQVGNMIAGIPKGLAQGAQAANAMTQAVRGNYGPMAQQMVPFATQQAMARAATPADAGTAERLAMQAGPLAGVNSPALASAARNRDLGGAVVASTPALAVAAAPLITKAGGAALDALKVGDKARAAAEGMYQSALKPSTTIPGPKVAAIVDTGLREGIPVSQGGLEKLAGLIDDTNNKIAATIQADPTRPINKFAVASRLSDTAKKFSTQVNPTADMNAIAEAGNDFLETQPGAINAADAQALKQGTYQQLKGKFGELKSASIESQKALARGLKEELANAFPELSDLNARDSQLYNLQGVLERAVNRIGNHQLIGIGTPIAAGGVKAVTGSNAAAAVIGTLKAVVDNPIVKSRLAIMLSKSGGGMGLGAANARVAAYSGALGSALSGGDTSEPSAGQK